MDWNWKDLTTRAADVFDLPADVIAALPHIELIGDCQLLMNRHEGILSYSTERIDVNGGAHHRGKPKADGHDRLRAACKGQDHRPATDRIGGR